MAKNNKKPRRKRTSIEISEGLWKEVKIRAVQEGRSFQDALVEALEDYLRKEKKGGRDAD